MSNPKENSVQTFENAQFGVLRTIQNERGEIWFCLADVCRALELQNPSYVKKRLITKGVFTNYTPTSGGQQQMLFINEPNLYRCIFQSRKKEAERFQDWVFEDVLPSIRKTGFYMVPKVTQKDVRTFMTEIDSDGDIVINSEDVIRSFNLIDSRVSGMLDGLAKSKYVKDEPGKVIKERKINGLTSYDMTITGFTLLAEKMHLAFLNKGAYYCILREFESVTKEREKARCKKYVALAESYRSENLLLKEKLRALPEKEEKKTISFTELSKRLNFDSVYSLMMFLSENHVLFRRQKAWYPHAEFSEKGYFVSLSSFQPKYGKSIALNHPRLAVTDAGVKMISDLVNEGKEVSL